MEEHIISLPKEFWLPNESSKSCHKCEKGFSAVSRKHHCRYCGLIFCNNCAKNNQKLNADQKLQRICDSCLTLVRSSGQSLTAKSISFNDSFISSSDELPEIDENILDFAQELLPNKAQALESCSSFILFYRCKSLLTPLSFSIEFTQSLILMIGEIVETVCPSVKFRNDDMDINSYIQFIKVTDSKQSCKFFQGTIIKKFIAHKRMPVNIDYPKILFLDELDEDENSLITMGNLISEDSDLSKIFVKKIISINPNVVVCRRGLPEKVITKLAKNNITAIIHVKEKGFRLLIRITGGRALTSINQVCLFDRFFGRCQSMKAEVFNGKSYVCFNEIKDFTLGGCVIVQAPEPKLVVNALKRLLVEYRNAKLERIVLLECGSRITDDTLCSLYSDQISVKEMKVCKENLCKPPEIIERKYYDLNDICLGSYLMALTQTSEDCCGKCKLLNKDHITYFLRNERIVKLSMFKVKPIKEGDLFLSTNCRDCHRSVSAHFVSNATWEYSLYKFLSNFFTPNTVLAKCGHPLFKNAFKFQIDHIQILFQYEDFKIFSLHFPGKIHTKPDFYKNLLSETLNETQISSKCVLDSILSQGKGIVVRINQEMSSVDAFYEQWLSLREKTLKVIENIYITMREVFEPDVSNFSRYLEVETMRRALFLECCKFKMLFEDIEGSIRKIKPSKKSNQSITLSASVLDPAYIDSDFLVDEDLLQYFYKLQSGNLTFPPCRTCVVPVLESDCGSWIGYTLSSASYYAEIGQVEQNIEQTLLNSQSPEWSLQFSSYDNMDSKPSDPVRKLYGDYIQASCTVFFPFQFHALRTALDLPHDSFISSISRTIFKSEELGKSAAVFKKTHDQLYILKIIEEKEFRMFLTLAPNYFIHACKSIFHSMPSIMNLCVGAFKVAIKNVSTGKNKSEWCLVFQNLGAELKPPVMSYDLKGTTNKRRKVKDGDKKTKMDLNFLEDFSALPLPITAVQMKRLEAAIINDSLFLSKQNIVDYSMLLVISFKDREISIGIIDYMQPYTLDKVIENRYKTVVSTQVPTITHPDQYKARFRDQILNHYFIVLD